MNLQHLYYFQAVAQYQSFTKAAEAIFVSQPTLTYAINNIEKELGCALIDRNGKNAILTAEGKAFLEYVNYSLKTLDNGVQLIRSTKENQFDTIRICTDRFMLITPDIKQFRQDYKNRNIKFTINKLKESEIEQHVINGDYDIGFQHCYPSTPGLCFSQYPDSEYVMIVSREHPLAKESSIDLGNVDWNQEVIVRDVMRPEPDTATHDIYSIYKKYGYDPRSSKSRASTFVGIAAMVEAGLGIAIVPEQDIIGRFDLKILKIENDIKKPTCYIIQKRGTGDIFSTSLFFDYINGRHGHPEIINL